MIIQNKDDVSCALDEITLDTLMESAIRMEGYAPGTERKFNFYVTKPERDKVIEELVDKNLILQVFEDRTLPEKPKYETLYHPALGHITFILITYESLEDLRARI